MRLTRIEGKSGDQVGLNDRGWSYGDALFETLYVAAGQVRLLSLHQQRLAHGFDRLGYYQPEQTLNRAWQQVLDFAHDLHQHQPIPWVVRLQVSRLATARGYKPSPDAQQQIVMQASPWQPAEGWVDGMALAWSDIQLARQPLLAGLKHCNRLEQVLARQAHRGPEAEILLCDQSGYLISGSMSNLLLFSENQALSPDLSQAGVAGVMRAFLLEALGTMGYNCCQRPVHPSELPDWPEALVCNALQGPVAVGAIGPHSFKYRPERLQALRSALIRVTPC